MISLSENPRIVAHWIEESTPVDPVVCSAQRGRFSDDSSPELGKL